MPEEDDKDEGKVSKVKLITLIISVPAALAALISVYQFLRTPAELQIVAASVETTGRPTLRATLRNTSNTPAVLTSAELVFESATVTEATEHASTELRPVTYNWIITLNDVEWKSSTLRLATRLEKQEPDALQFLMGFEKRHATFDSRARLRLHYNADQVAESAPFDLRIINGAGDFPQFSFPNNSVDLAAALRTIDTPFATRQIIEELASRRFAPAAPDVQRYFSHPDPTVRTAVAQYFTEVGDPAATASLATLVEATDPSVRRAALKALVVRGKSAFGDVERLMGNKDPAVRDAVLSIFHAFPSDRAVALATRSLDDRSVASVVDGEEVLVAAAALRALARMGATSEADGIIRKLADAHPSVQLAAIDAVVDLRLLQAIPELQRIAASGDPRIKEEASAALTELQ